MLKYATASIALLAFSNPALAAACATPSEASALKTAVMQQELMVAALQCRESAAYNRFVNTYRPELQTSDSSLKAFFVRRGGEHGEAGYDAFKTKAANLSALENARDARAFCADARSLFQAALAHRGSLMSFVDQRALASDMGNVCIESKPQPVLAKLDNKQAPAKAIAVAAAAAAPVKVAQAAPRAEVAVAGVPSHSLPAIPYQRERDDVDLTPPPAPQEMAVERRELARAEPQRVQPRPQFQPEEAVDDQDDTAPTYAAEEEAPPPPQPRYYRVRERRYDDDYAYAYAPRRSYGPPPGWQQGWRDYPAPAPYRWYPRGYSNW
jgi:hypothetical protein